MVGLVEIAQSILSEGEIDAVERYLKMFTYHFSDEESQVIFYGPSVRDIYPCLQKDKESDIWALVRRDGTSIREGKLKELVNWITRKVPHSYLL